MQDLLVETRFSVSLRRRRQRAGAGVPAEPGPAAGRRRSSTAARATRSATGFNPYAPKAPHFKPRATAVISLFMSGGVSHIDTFDPKPALTKYAGQPLDGKVGGDVIVRQGHPGPLMPSPFSFKKYGQSGMEVSDLFPHIARTRRRHRLRAIGLRPVERPRAGDLRDADRADPHGVPEPRIVGHLRTRIGEREPAGVRGDSGRVAAARSAASTTGARDSCRPPIRGRCSARPAIRSST